MGGKLYNLARMTTATTGTGTITLGAAASGFLTFAGAGVSDGDVVSYGISDGANSEVGTGTYTASGTTLTRTVTKSTNSNTAISLSGTAQVFITPRAEDLPWLTASVNNAIGADVLLNNTANYFDGPSCAQGTAGTWLATGSVAVLDTGGASTINAKLWDGTTVIASMSTVTPGASLTVLIPMSGVLANPAGNLRISVQDSSRTTGKIISNNSGLGKDSTLTAIRIA